MISEQSNTAHNTTDMAQTTRNSDNVARVEVGGCKVYSCRWLARNGLYATTEKVSSTQAFTLETRSQTHTAASPIELLSGQATFVIINHAPS